MRGIGTTVYRASLGFIEKSTAKTPATVRRLTMASGITWAIKDSK